MASVGAGIEFDSSAYDIWAPLARPGALQVRARHLGLDVRSGGELLNPDRTAPGSVLLSIRGEQTCNESR